MFHRKCTYCRQYGLSVPSWWATRAICASVGLRPAARRGGVAPGDWERTWKGGQGSDVSTATWRIAAPIRVIVNRLIGVLLGWPGSSPGFRVERVAQPIAQQVERQHREDERETG